MADGTIEYLLRVQDQASQPLETAAVAATKFGTSSKQAGADAQNLRFQLIDLTQGILSGQDPMRVLMQQGGQIAQVFMGGASATSVLSAALGGLVGTLGPVALAAGGLYLAYKAATESGERFAATNVMIGEVMQITAKYQEQVIEGLIRLRVETGELTQAQGSLEMATRRTYAQYLSDISAVRERLSEIAVEQDTFTTSIGNMAESMQTVANPAAIIFGKMLDGVTTSSAELDEEQAHLRASLEQSGAAMGATVEVAGRVATAHDEAKGKARQHREEITRLKEEVLSLADVWGILAGTVTGDPFVDAMMEAGRAAEAETTKAKGDAIKAKLAELSAWMGEQAKTERESNAETARLKAEATMDAMARVSLAGSAVGSFLGGDAQGLVSALAPAIGAALGGAVGGAAGGAVATAAGGLAQLGEKGAQATADEMGEWFDDLLQGILELPALFIEAAPELLWSLIEALAELPFRFAEAVWDAVAGALGIDGDKIDTWMEQATDIRAAAGVGAPMQTGGTQRTAGDLSWLAAPRVATSATQRKVGRSAQAPTVVINTMSAHPDFAPAMVQQVDQVYGPYGLRSSPNWGS